MQKLSLAQEWSRGCQLLALRKMLCIRTTPPNASYRTRWASLSVPHKASLIWGIAAHGLFPATQAWHRQCLITIMQQMVCTCKPPPAGAQGHLPGGLAQVWNAGYVSHVTVRWGC